MDELHKITRFLLGEAELDGIWFNEFKHGEKGRFWWRKNLREVMAKIDVPAEKYICCDEMGKALGNHNGLHSQTIGSIDSDVIDSIIVYKGGEYRINNRIVVQYCPFCGKPRRRASEYKHESN